MVEFVAPAPLYTKLAYPVFRFLSPPPPHLNVELSLCHGKSTTCRQDGFALLVPSLLTTCYKVVELNRLVISCSNNLLSSCNSNISQQVVSDNLVAT
jgi:hypothetical protein